MPNPLYWADPLGLMCKPLTCKQKKQIEQLRSGQDIYVKDVHEARALLDAMPELQPHIDKIPLPSTLSSINGLENLWKQAKNTYREDTL